MAIGVKVFEGVNVGQGVKVTVGEAVKVGKGVPDIDSAMTLVVDCQDTYNAPARADREQHIKTGPTKSAMNQLAGK